MASYRILHVGNKRRTEHAHCFCFSRLHHWYRVWQLRMVCFYLHCTTCICFCTTISRRENPYPSRVYGKAIRTVHTRNTRLVHHCHCTHLMARTHTLCWRSTYSSDFWHSDVDVSMPTTCHLCVLYNPWRTKGSGVYQCLSDGAAHHCFCYTHHRGNCDPWRWLFLRGHRETGWSKRRAWELLASLPFERRVAGILLASYPPRLSHLRTLVLVYRPKHGATCSGGKRP